MGLPGHRRTSSHKRRRASHFALVEPSTTVDKAGRTHRMHRAVPGATEYNGIKIHVKGLDRKLAKALEKTKPKQAHKHEDHDHTQKKDAPSKTKNEKVAKANLPPKAKIRAKKP